MPTKLATRSRIMPSNEHNAEHQWALDQARQLLGLVRQAPPSIPLAHVVRAGAPPRVVASYGAGVDSTALLTRMLTDPTCRDFALDELVVLTAGTGHEWPGTLDLVSIGNPSYRNMRISLTAACQQRSRFSPHSRRDARRRPIRKCRMRPVDDGWRGAHALGRLPVTANSNRLATDTA